MLTRREVMTTVGAMVVARSVLAARRADETLKGELVCAKCYLKKADATECQDVLLVKNATGETTEYYVTKNKVSLDSGEACTEKIPTTIVGSVSEKDNRKWITASRIDKATKP
jgi:hypothetical protein